MALRRPPFINRAAVLLVVGLAVGRAAAVCVIDQDCLGGGLPDQCLGCVNGECALSAKNCGDNDPCTDDYCESPGRGCYHTPHCPDDGLVCTGIEICIPTFIPPSFFVPMCLQVAAPDCNDRNACTVDSRCTEPFACKHIALDCNDGDPCTADSCDPESGCIHAQVFGCCSVAADCIDPCSVGRLCVNLQCTAGTHTDENCNDDDPCTTDVCDGGGCLHAPIAACGGIPCRNDGDCTSACASGRICLGGTCTAGVLGACDDGDPCTVDSCDATAGCVGGPLPGFDALACVCERSQPTSCTDQPVPKVLTNRFTSACTSIARAKAATGKKRTKLVTRAVRQFTKAMKLATKAAGHKGLSASCGTALADRFTDNRARAIAVRSQP